MKQKEKKDLTQLPFCCVFEPGLNEEGFWTYQYTVMQLEDCIDCVRVLLPEFDHVFLFDSLSSHQKKREQGLDASAMNNGYGGAQPQMWDTTIESTEGFL